VVEPPPPPPSLEARVRTAWPSQHGGHLLQVWTSEGPPPRVRVAHLGAELGSVGRELLATAVALEGSVPEGVPEIDELALTAIEGVASEEWTQRLEAMLTHAPVFPEVQFCVTTPTPPSPPPRRRPRPDPADVRARELSTERASAQANIHVRDGERWGVVPQLDPCPAPPPPDPK
jgi:hypothetical protein